MSGWPSFDQQEAGVGASALPQKVLMAAVDTALHAPETFPQQAVAQVGQTGTNVARLLEVSREGMARSRFVPASGWVGQSDTQKCGWVGAWSG